MKHTMKKVKKLLGERLEKIENGEIRWTVANQMDECILQRALANLNQETLQKVNDQFSMTKNLNAMDVAYFLDNEDKVEMEQFFNSSYFN
jgi:hypothetical protein